jgi:hypothetical protein
LSFSSKYSTGKFPQTLFIDNFFFQFSVFDQNSIQVFTTDPPTQDFFISISISFSFFKTNNIKSFQTRTQFSKDNPMIFFNFPIVLKNIYRIRVEISNFSYEFHTNTNLSPSFIPSSSHPSEVQHLSSSQSLTIQSTI